MNEDYYVYILGNKQLNLYIGMTNDLVRRVYQHKQKLVEGFTEKYNLKNLLYFEIFKTSRDAITREKQLKHWNRQWKLNLIRKSNPNFEDLYEGII